MLELIVYRAGEGTEVSAALSSADREAAAQELQSPTVTPERLAQIAAEDWSLHPAVAAHPNAYPALIEWIAAQTPVAVPVVPQPPVAAPTAAPVTAQPPVAQPQVAAPTAPQVPTVAPPAEPQVAAAPAPAALSGSARTRAVLAGLGIGVVIGAVVSAVLLLWVLPGLFGSVIG